MKAAHEIDDPHEEADADVDLHIAVYEAAHNIVFLHVMRVLAELLREGVLYNRDQLYRRAGARDLLLAQHVAIAEAVLAGELVAIFPEGGITAPAPISSPASARWRRTRDEAPPSPYLHRLLRRSPCPP